MDENLKNTVKTNYLGDKVFLGWKKIGETVIGAVIFHPNPDVNDMDNPECVGEFVCNEAMATIVKDIPFLKFENNDFERPTFTGEYVCKCGFKGEILDGKWVGDKG